MRACRGQSGFTLSELLVVATLSALLAVLGTQAFRPVARGTRTLRARASAVSELRAATESLLRDLGGTRTASATLGGNLRLRREPAVAALHAELLLGIDPGIVYALDSGDLVRTDDALDTTRVVARGLTEFALRRTGPRQLQITLAAHDGTDSPGLTLLWDESGDGP